MSDDVVSIAAFAGSLRKGSYNRMLLRAAVELAPPEIKVVPFDIDDVPLFNDDLDSDEHPLPSVKRLRDAIRSADALLIASPEYNWSIPAVTKNVLDWASREDGVLEHKPTAIMGASTGGFGTVRMQIAIRTVAGFTDQWFLNDPQVHVARAREKFDADGRLTDETTRQQVVELVVALAAFARRIKRSSA
ncbi:MAG TPA: NADPH-dependent FMN reductase [Candidatus Eremiobacteraceae bacterium]|nr:NADPH-dependent FMN reductase [Candidatus Eremiobacteraceae bacterium]